MVITNVVEIPSLSQNCDSYFNADPKLYAKSQNQKKLLQ